MLRSRSFSERWISLICRAIFGLWYSIIVNGFCHGFFQSNGGLRQGDLLSLCLFIIAAKFLSRSLDSFYSWYPSMAYRTSAPMTVSHLSFADDIVIFINGSRSSLRRLLDFLRHYRTISGQCINQDKSSFYIRDLVTASCQTIVHSVTSFQRRKLPFTYLGCPIFKGCHKISLFDDMVQKVRIRSYNGPTDCSLVEGN